MSRQPNPLEGLRSSLAEAAFAVEERLLWRGEDGMGRFLDAARWPFERAAWAIERAVVWPLEERTGEWGGTMRTLGVAAAALLATAVGVLGLVWVSGGGDGGAKLRPAAQSPGTVARTPAQPATTAAAPAALAGTKPNFKLEAGGGNSAVGEEAAGAAAEAGAIDSSASSSSAKVVKAGPAATKVAHRFAGAFVLYETGVDNAKVRAIFNETANPKVAHTLLRRPPRLPAGAKVPQAKVLNIVPGPRHGNTYTLSASLLRLGITSELRLHMERDKRSGEWQVTEVVG